MFIVMVPEMGFRQENNARLPEVKYEIASSTVGTEARKMAKPLLGGTTSTDTKHALIHRVGYSAG